MDMPSSPGRARFSIRGLAAASALPLDGAALRRALAALPPAVLRAKGIVSLAEAPGRRFVLQLVGRRWSLEPKDSVRGSALAGPSEIVSIGLPASSTWTSCRHCLRPPCPPACRLLSRPC